MAKDKKANVTISFESDEAAKAFADWLNDMGEQSYWVYMECQDNPHVAHEFDYGTLKCHEIRIKAQ